MEDEVKYNQLVSPDDDFDPLISRLVHQEVKNCPFHYNCQNNKNSDLILIGTLFPLTG